MIGGTICPICDGWMVKNSDGKPRCVKCGRTLEGAMEYLEKDLKFLETKQRLEND